MIHDTMKGFRRLLKPQNIIFKEGNNTMTNNATFTRNTALHGLEISFTQKPSKSVLDSLKAEGFRWHSVKKLWYAKETESRLRLLQTITGTQEATEGTQAQPTAQKAQEAPQNKYNVKVGDVFWMSWGYDQTNNDFFQVVKLCGSASVRVVQVYPQYDTEYSYSHGMAEDRSYKFTGKMLPRAERSIFISDQEKGDVKRLTSFYADGRPQIKIGNHHCDKVEGTLKTYESWYA